MLMMLGSMANLCGLPGAADAHDAVVCSGQCRVPGPADAHDAGVCGGQCRVPGPADALDAGVLRVDVECLAQLVLMMLGFITQVWNAWSS